MPTRPEHAPEAAFVFVHGIGTQGAGRTLLQHTSNLVRWIDSTGTRSLTSLRVDVEQATVAGLEPHSVRLRLWLQDGDDAPVRAQATVVATEAHWADSFLPPRSTDTLRWMLGRAPALIIVRAVDGQRAAWHRWWSCPLQWWRIVAAGLLMVLAIPAFWSLFLVLTASTGVRVLVPIPAVRRALATLETILTQVIGDSQVFSEDPVQRAALVTEVRTAVRAAAETAPVLVVVAHSQGAAVTVDALTGTDVHCSLVTLGSGILPLRTLRVVQAFPAKVATTMWTVATIGVAAYVFFAVRARDRKRSTGRRLGRRGAGRLVGRPPGSVDDRARLLQKREQSCRR